MHKFWPTASVILLGSPRILLRRQALRIQEICFGVAAVPRETEWIERAVKEHDKLQGQKLCSLISISSVLICHNCLLSSEGVCVAHSIYGIFYGVDERRLVFRFLVAAVCCALTHILQIWSRDELPFYWRDTRGYFFWGERLQRVTPIIVGHVAGLTWKNRSILYTWQLKLLVTFIAYTQLTNSAEVCIIDCWRRVLDTY